MLHCNVHGGDGPAPASGADKQRSVSEARRSGGDCVASNTIQLPSFASEHAKVWMTPLLSATRHRFPILSPPVVTRGGEVELSSKYTWL